jgi:hypothetical protein
MNCQDVKVRPIMRLGAMFVKDPRVKLGKDSVGLRMADQNLPGMQHLLLDRLTFDQYRL